MTDHTTRRPGTTGVPSTHDGAPGPTASTVPTCSCPSSAGTGDARLPFTVCRSLPHTVARSMRTSTSPSPGDAGVVVVTSVNGRSTPSQRA